MIPQDLNSLSATTKMVYWKMNGKTTLILICGFFVTNFLFAQTEIFSEPKKAEPDLTFSDVKSFHLNKQPVDKSQYEERVEPVAKERNKAFNLPYNFMVFQSEKESSSDINRVNGGLVFMNRSEFKAMGLTLIKGELLTVLLNEFDILISEKLATQLFGSENPINRILIMDDQYAVLVKGVFRGSSFPYMEDLDFVAGKPTYEKIHEFRN